ncbi:Ankyrin repeat-containing domain, partial [Trinorchestia longiramus]
ILHLTVEQRSVECLKYLLNDHVFLGCLNIPNIYGRTPLHYAVEEAALGWSTFGLECVRRFLQKDANPNARDENGDTPLHTYVTIIMNSDRVNEEGSLKCLNALLDHEKTDV